MTERVDLTDFLPPYLVEVEELIATAKTQLLAAEAAARTGASNPRAVRELFRNLHTIKGLSGMVDVTPVVALSHVMEEVLRDADRRGGQLPLSAVEPLLRGILAIETRVRSLAAGRPVAVAPPELLEALEQLSWERPIAASPVATLVLEPTLDSKLSASEREQLRAGAQSGSSIVQLDFVPSSERSAAGLNINSVRERAGKLAEIVKVVPVASPPGADRPGGLKFTLLLLSRESSGALAEAIGLEADEVRVLAAGTVAPVQAGPSLAELQDEEGAQSHDVVRVDVRRLDEAMDRLSALVVTRSRLQRAVHQLTASGAPTRELQQILTENSRQLRDLRAAIVSVRMVSASQVLERLPLMVRGLRRATGKEVRLELEVAGAEVDKGVGDRLFPAIVHLVRNAVDHAIEVPDERARLGKPTEGVVRVECRARSNARLEIIVRDDGRGILAAQVAARANAEVPSTSEQLLELLCRPGLSTRDAVTEISGRGMGMDIVRRVVVQELGGELSIETTPGQGTAFTLSVPLTLTILEAFIFECGGQRYAVPVSAVEEWMDVEASKLVQVPSGRGVGPPAFLMAET